MNYWLFIVLCDCVFILTFTFVEILIGLFMKKGIVHRKGLGERREKHLQREKTRIISLSIL